jgi:lactoylglutathione lyase
MRHAIHHIHLKSPDPMKTAEWYVEAFGFTILSDATRPTGDRFVRCESPDGVKINVSGAKTGEQMNESDGDPHWGLEHFGIAIQDMRAELERLQGLGATVISGPTKGATGRSIAFILGPDATRIELVEVE